MKKLSVIILLITVLLTGCSGGKRVKSFGAGAFSFVYGTDDTFARGERAVVYVEVTNRQKTSHTWVGSSSVSPWVYVVCRENGFVDRLTSGGNDDTGPQEFPAGDTRGSEHFFTLPEYAPAGSYSLVCQYGGADNFSTTSFLDVFTLDGDTDEDIAGEPGKAAEFGYGAFSFSYKAAGSTIERGKEFKVDVDITNLQSESYSVNDLFGTVLLVCRENGFILRPEVPKYVWFEDLSFAPGETCTASRTFKLPDYAPSGSYCLFCQCGGWENFTAASFVDVFTLSN